jgi:hypothetical protein
MVDVKSIKSLGVVKTTSGWENRAAHGIMSTHGIPHGTVPN